MPEVEQPPGLPSSTTYRPPRVAGYDDDQQRENWSDTSSESEGDQKEAPIVKRSGNAAVAQVYRQHRRTRPMETISARRSGDDGRAVHVSQRGPRERLVSFLPTSPSRSSKSRSGSWGQAIPYNPYPGSYLFPPAHPQAPFGPSSSRQSGHYPGHLYPPSSFPTSPYPTPQCPPYSGSPYSVHPPPANAFPASNYAPPSAAPLYDDFAPPRHQPHLIIKSTFVENKLEQVEKELSEMRSENRARRWREKERKSNEEYERLMAEGTNRKEGRKKKQDKLRREAEREAIYEEDQVASTARSRREASRPRIDQKEVPDMIRIATDHAVESMSRIERQGGNDVLGEKRRVDETESILLEVVQLVEERLPQQERRALEERSMGSNRSRRMEITKREPENVPGQVDVVLRSQIEDIVLDVLARLKVRQRVEETAYASETLTGLARQVQDVSAMRSPKRIDTALNDQRFEGWHDNNYDGREPLTPGSQGQSSPTAVDHRDQYPNGSASRESFVLLRSSDPGTNSGRIQHARPHLKRVVSRPPAIKSAHGQPGRTFAEDNYRSPVYSSQNATRATKNASDRREDQGGGNAEPVGNLGRGMLDIAPRRNARNLDATIVNPAYNDLSSSNESDAEVRLPLRSTRYALVAPQDGRHNCRREDNTLAPPSVPDAPSAESRPNRRSRRLQVTTDVEDSGR